MDINNNVVKCCDSEGLLLKKTPRKMKYFTPIRLCELYSGELLVVQLNKSERGRITALKRSLSGRDASHKNTFKDLKNICVIRQMWEDKQRFYCGDSAGFIHRVALNKSTATHKFHSVLPRVYHLAASQGLIAANDGNLQGDVIQS